MVLHRPKRIGCASLCDRVTPLDGVNASVLSIWVCLRTHLVVRVLLELWIIGSGSC